MDELSQLMDEVRASRALSLTARYTRGQDGDEVGPLQVTNAEPTDRQSCVTPTSDVRRVTGGTRSAAGDFLRAPTSTADQTDHHANNKKESTTSRIRALSRLWCEVAPAEIRTCNLPIANPALYQTATRAPSINYIRSNYLRLQRLT